MINSVRLYLKNNSIYRKKIIVALSGGPDSVTLLSILFQLKNEFNLIIEAAYVNHGIRSIEENEKDSTLVKKLCVERSVKLHILNIPYNKIVSESSLLGSSIEAVARDFRYNFFNTLLEDGDLIAIVHNRDDQVETQIMRFFQGSSIDGLLGIKNRRENIIRPLFDIDKKSIISYLKSKGISYNIDHTNNQLDYLRNSIRHKIIPEIEKVFPSYKKALKNIEEELRDYKNIVDQCFKPICWEDHDGVFICNYDNFILLPTLKRRDEIYNIFDISFKGNTKSYRLPKRFLEPLSKNHYKNGEIILEGYGFILVRKDDLLIWKHIELKDFFFKIFIKNSGIYKNSRIKIRINNQIGDIFVPGLDYPFSIRSYVAGYPENKIIKKINKTFHNYNHLFVVEKDNRVYAILYMKKIIYIKSKSQKGLYIDII